MAERNENPAILTTKLYTPPPRANLVTRPRLLERLNQGLEPSRKLILVSAPAGFGKTTLVSEWVKTISGSQEYEVRGPKKARPTTPVSSSLSPPRKAAWLSLDEADNDLPRFLTYLVAALRQIEANLGESILTRLQSLQPPPLTTLLTSLINEVTAIAPSAVLVLDDYHLIETKAIHDALTFFLDYLPPQMRLVITSRTDPPLPLSRWRIRGELVELRVLDLRFTRAETAELFNTVLNLSLSAEDIAALERRTEGWIAGLQVAALSVQSQKNDQISNFIQAFTGSHRYILDYLADEVLQQQPPEIQAFLLQTSILDRMCGPLGDALVSQRETSLRSKGATKPSNSQKILEYLERANLFIVPLDNERRWYRYHHLFADFLRERLRQTWPDQILDLHRRAASWYEKNGLMVEAIQHGLAAQDFEQAARLIEKHAYKILSRRETATLLNWLEALPAEQVKSRPYLSLSYAWALLFSGQLDTAEVWLTEVEHHLDPHPTGTQSRQLQGQVMALGSLLACYRGEVAQAVSLSRRALPHIPKDDLFLRCSMALNIALNLADTSGTLSATVTEAGQMLAEAAAASRTAADVHTTLLTTGMQGQIEATQGRLKQAATTFKRALRIAQKQAEKAGQLPAVAGTTYVGLGELLYEWNELEAARQRVQTGLELSQTAEGMGMLSNGYIPLARIYQAQGQSDKAIEALHQAEQVARQSNITWMVSRVAACRARLMLLQGNLNAAGRWAEKCGLQVGDNIGYRREGEYVTLARVYLAQDKYREARRLLAWLLEVVEEVGLRGSALEILALQAMLYQLQGDTVVAMANLERALSLAEPDGYVRLFVDEGQPMKGLLARMKAPEAGRRMKIYISQLLNAFGVAESIHPSHGAFINQPLAEPLTDRELEVLQLLAAGLSNREIAGELVIAAGTVKVHVKNIYGKLDVHNRTQAAARARELNLLV